MRMKAYTKKNSEGVRVGIEDPAERCIEIAADGHPEQHFIVTVIWGNSGDLLDRFATPEEARRCAREHSRVLNVEIRDML
jgi:hypothetical protein